MSETTVYSHLLALGLISLVLNSFLLFPLASLNFAGSVLYSIYASLQVQPAFSIPAAVIYIGFFLFSIAFSVVAIIGSVLGFMYNDKVRRIGLTMLIVTNVILLFFFVANFIILVAGFIVAGASPGNSILFIPASLAPVICVCQCVVLGYGTFYVGIICNSFEIRKVKKEPI